MGSIDYFIPFGHNIKFSTKIIIFPCKSGQSASVPWLPCLWALGTASCANQSLEVSLHPSLSPMLYGFLNFYVFFLTSNLTSYPGCGCSLLIPFHLFSVPVHPSQWYWRDLLTVENNLCDPVKIYVKICVRVCACLCVCVCARARADFRVRCKCSVM